MTRSRANQPSIQGGGLLVKGPKGPDKRLQPPITSKHVLSADQGRSVPRMPPNQPKSTNTKRGSVVSTFWVHPKERPTNLRPFFDLGRCCLLDLGHAYRRRPQQPFVRAD